MHLGRVAAIIFVALDGSGEPPFDVAGRSEQRLAELGRSAAEGDPLEAFAVVAAGQSADMVLADDRGFEQPRRSRGDARRRPAGAVRPGSGERVKTVDVSSEDRNKFSIDDADILELAKQALKHIIEDVETEVNLDFIQKTVAEYFQVSLDSLKAKTRKKEIVTARQVAMYFAKEFTSHSLKSIGYHFGGRDHSTVIHSVQTVSDLIDTDKKFKASIQELQKKFKVKST